MRDGTSKNTVIELIEKLNVERVSLFAVAKRGIWHQCKYEYWRPTLHFGKVQMAVNLQRFIRSTLCLVLRWGLWGRQIEQCYFQLHQIQDGAGGHFDNFKWPYLCSGQPEPLRYFDHFGTSVDTQQWTQPVTAGVHGVNSKKCRLEVVE